MISWIFFLLACLLCFIVGRYLYKMGGTQIIDESELEKQKLKTKMLFAAKSQGLVIMIVAILAFIMGILKIIIG